MQQHEQRRAAPPPSEYAVAPPTASAAAAQQTQPQHTPFFLFPKSMCTFHGITFTVDPRYTIRCHVGQGAQGVIWSAVDTHSPTQKEIAVKKMPNALDEVLAAKRLLRELRLLRHLKHENIVALLDIMLPPSTNVLLWKDVYAVYDLMDTDLEYVIKSGQEITNDHVKYFSAQLLSGIAYLHRCQVVHRDLKPGNILIDRDCRLKICDFGLARSCAKQSDNDSNQLLTMYVTTRWYRAPELLCFNTAYGEAVDMWSAGCIVAELLLRRPLFQGTDPLNQLEQVVQLIGRPSEADLENVMNESALQFLENLPQSEAQLEETLSMASASAIELIRGMLRFNRRRASPPTSAPAPVPRGIRARHRHGRRCRARGARAGAALGVADDYRAVDAADGAAAEPDLPGDAPLPPGGDRAQVGRRAVLTRRGGERRWEAVGEEPGRSADALDDYVVVVRRIPSPYLVCSYDTCPCTMDMCDT